MVHHLVVSDLSVTHRLNDIMKCCMNKTILFRVLEEPSLFFVSDSKAVQWCVSDLFNNFFLTHREYFCFQLSSIDHITLRRSKIARDVIYKRI